MTGDVACLHPEDVVRIAMIGAKGIPASHGGIERHVEELSIRMAARGHEVVVYTRPRYVDPGLHIYRGVRLVSLPSVDTKHLDTITHVSLCTMHAMRSGIDIFHYQAVGPALLSWVPRGARRATVVTVHGRDWQRDKWGPLANRALRVSEWVSFKVPQATISVSRSLADELERVYRRPATFIPNGVSVISGSDDSVLSRHGLEPGRYVLFAARLVPEKGCHYLIEAWRRAGPAGFRLVVAGGTSHSDGYVERLKASADASVVFSGFVFGPALASLFRNAALFVLPSDLEGLPIVLLEALGYGTPVLASDIPQNREVLGSFGTTFRAGSVDDLAATLASCLERRDALKAEAQEARAVVAADYDWETITDRTLALYRSLLD